MDLALAVPPLEISDRFIDNPAFAFLPALMWAAAMRRKRKVHVENALLSGAPLLRTPKGWLIGGEPAAFWERLGKLPYKDLVVAWTSFHRRSDPLAMTLPVESHPIFHKGAVHIAEFWHGESRFEPLHPDWNLLKKRPFATVLNASNPEINDFLGLDTHPADDVLSLSFLGKKEREALGRLEPLLRTGAARGAVESFPAGSEFRKQGRVFPWLTSTGCSYRCLFCHKPGHAGVWRPRPLEVLKEELDGMVQAGVKLLFILDPIANHDEKRFATVLELLRERELKAVFPNGLGLWRLNERLLSTLRKVTGDLVVSIESGSANTLKILRKPVDLGQVERVVKDAKELGFAMSAHYIVGVPGERPGDVASTLALATKLHERFGVMPSIQPYVPVEQSDEGALDSGKQGRGDDPAMDESPVGLHGAIAWTHEGVRSQETPKVIVNLTYLCNNQCVFCAVGDRPRVHGLLNEQIRLLKEARQQGVRHVDFDGGEPTLYPGLFTLLQVATDLGYERIHITTNGRTLCYPALADKLANFSNVELSISLHGPDVQTHETLTRAQGSFHQTLTGIHHALRAGLKVTLNITAVGQNVSKLHETVRLGVENGINRVAIQRYTPFGLPQAHFEPDEHQVLEEIRKVRQDFPAIALSLVNFCACEVGPFGLLAAGDQAKAVRTMQFVDLREVSLADYLGQRRRHRPACDPCYLRKLCLGKWELGGPAQRSEELIDLTPGLRCSERCAFCAVPSELSEKQMDTRAAFEMLERLAPRKPGALRFSGGEPTERPDLPLLIEHARALGYTKIGIQTHGLRLEDVAYLEELTQRGLEDIRFSLFGASNEAYEAVMGQKMGFSRWFRAIGMALARLGDGVGVDILMLRPFLPDLHTTVRKVLDLGVRDVLLWLPAFEGRALREGGQHLIPTLREVRVPLQQTLSLCDSKKGIRIRSIYVPLCMLGPHRDKAYDVRGADILIVNPQAVLAMSRCAIDLGIFPPRCGPCTLRHRCMGLRPSYVQRRGDEEVEPIVED